jgi:hypothetical protein
VGRLAPWAIVASALAYPLAVLAFSGEPTFPSRAECVHPATRDGDIEAVFGYFESEREAAGARDRALSVGFQGTEVKRNGCGLVRVFVPGIATLEVGREFAEQAQSVGFDVALEQGG